MPERPRFSGPALALLLCAAAPSCSAELPPPAPPPAPLAPRVLLPTTHGIAAGDARPTEITLWSRTAGDGFFHAEVKGPGGTFSAITRAVAARDFTARARITGLTPGSRYDYRIWFEPAPSPDAPPPEGAARGSFRTPPRPTEARPLTFAWSGDLGGQNVCRDAVQGYPIFKHIPGAELDFFLALGDMIYADDPCHAKGALGNAQVPLATGYSSRLRDYWDHWRYNREDPGYVGLLASTSVYAVWDDHEVVNDFGPEEASRGGKPWIPGVSLLPLGRQALLDYNPIADDAEDPGKLYRSFTWGKHAELLLLDTRQYRDRNARDDTKDAPKTLLGAEQKAWLSRTLRASEPTWTLVVSSVPISIPTGHPVLPLRDGWASGDSQRGFERELRTVFAELHASGRRNVLWLTTDVHFAAVYRYVPLPEHPDFVVHEAVVGPLAAGLFPRREFDTTFGTERLFFHGPNAWSDVKSFAALLPWLSFGRVDVDAGGMLSLGIVDGLGKTIYTQRLAPVNP